MTVAGLLGVLLDNLVPAALAASAGYLFSRSFRPDVKAISRMAFYLFGPCLVFKLITDGELGGSEFGRLAMFTAASVLLSGGAALVASRLFSLPRSTAAAVMLSTMFVNGGNLGLPLNLYAFGQPGMDRAVVYFIVSTTLVYTLGVYLASNGKVSGREAALKVLRVPVLYALPVAGLIRWSDWSLPLAAQRAVDLLAAAAIPTMLVLLGMQLASVRMRGRLGPVSLVVGLRLLGGPLLGLVLTGLLGLTGSARQAAILESAMPTAVINTILAVEFEGQPELVSSAVLGTTLLSPLTLVPLIAFLQAV